MLRLTPGRKRKLQIVFFIVEVVCFYQLISGGNLWEASLMPIEWLRGLMEKVKDAEEVV